jgi:hypothetical protein
MNKQMQSCLSSLIVFISGHVIAQPELDRFVLPGGGGTASSSDAGGSEGVGSFVFMTVGFGQPMVFTSVQGPFKMELGFYPRADCRADLTGEGELNFFDISLFLSLYNSQNPIADFTGDGQFNFFDVSAFLGAFNAGCP